MGATKDCRDLYWHVENRFEIRGASINRFGI
jgi:hypothetical protein